jgi:hypothetical protein
MTDELTAHEVDALEELGDEIAVLAAHVHAATYRLLTLIRDFDRRRGWAVDGFCSCAHWLEFRTGIDRGAAREKVRVARALAELPEVSAALERGEISFAKARCITRVADADNENELLEFAHAHTAGEMERLVRGWRRLNRVDEAELERVRHRSRCLSVFPDDDGMYIIRGRLDPEVGAMLMRAIEAASDTLFRAETADEIEPAQRRADAIGLLAEAALAAGLGQTAVEKDDDVATDESGEPSAPTSRVSGTRAERYQVVLHVDPPTLEWGRDPGRSSLEDGTRVAAETSRRLTCDASVVRMTHDHDGNVLDVGRRTRTIPPALRRALDARDRGCRFPGCGLRFTDGHHIIHWADGGCTSLENTVLLCRHHHRLVHEDGWRLELQVDGRPTFYNRRGLPVQDLPQRAPAAVADALIEENRRRDITPDYRSGMARYRRAADVPWGVYARVVDALESGAPGP